MKFTGCRPLFLLLVLTLTAACSTALAQQDVPFANGVPVPPSGFENIPLADGPWRFRTAEGMDIRVELVARMEYAMALEFLPDDSILVATRRGILYHLQDGSMREVGGTPASVFIGDSGTLGTAHGYQDVVLHPDFAQNRLVYLVYAKPHEANPRGTIAIGRGRWNGSELEDFRDIFGGKGETSGISRIAFGRDGKLYVTTSGGGDPQTLDNIAGKVLRLNDDGSIPPDNPFSGTSGARPEIYSYGHRSALGIAVHPQTGAIWQAENGPNGGDELNIIEAGLNYGWPVVSLGRTYQGPWQSELPSHHGYQPPVAYWMPAIAVSGLLFYTGDALPKWQGDVFVGSLRTGEVNGTGHIERILMNADMEELRRESLLTELHKRMRDLTQGPDGNIYVAIEESDGGILRIMPAD